MLKSIALAGFSGLIATAAFAADLGSKKPAPAAPVSVSCKETAASALPADAFGFSTGSDVSDVGAWALQFEYNGAYKGAGFKPGSFNSHLGKVQVSTAFLPCWEVGPYVLGVMTEGKNRFVFGSIDTKAFGVGIENKYKLLGRATHGFGLTLVLDQNYQGFEADNSQVIPKLGWSGGQFNSTYKLLLDKELIAGKLFGAVNVQIDQSWTERPGKVNPRLGTTDWVRGSNLSLTGALSYQAVDGLFLGAEARYVRTHVGPLFNRYAGDALFLGPTVYWQATKNIALSGAWGVQVMGDTKVLLPALPTLPQISSDLNLNTQSQHIAKFKVAVSF